MVLSLTTLTGLVLFLHGLTDYHQALSPQTRTTINTILAISVGALAIFWIWRIFRTPQSSTAALADETLGDARRSSLGATFLSVLEADTPMKAFHLERSLEEAGEHLGKVPFLARIPTKAIVRNAILLLVLGAVIFGVKASSPAPFSVVLQRILHPGSDTPPYSPLVFEVTPDQPQAIYQGEATVEVKISGGEVNEDVYCLIRNRATGQIDKTATFQGNNGTYARKFENTLEPLDFAFATGRARSNWHQLEVLFQPRISGTEVTITPPAYTGLPPETYPLDAAEIRALEGSTVQLTISSNRPLAGGVLSVSPLDESRIEVPEEVSAEIVEGDRASFTWTARRSSKLSALIHDIRHTPSDKPLSLTLKTVSDLAPVVSLDEPQAMVLATPRTKIPMAGEVEDDHGLSKVSLTRTLVGYRDRNRQLAEGLSRKDYQFGEALELEPLGVEPGQVLEFYLEANDRNPSLLGVGVSEVVRVQIISEEDYAQRIRNKLNLKKFTARYRALAQALKESRDALAELKKNPSKENIAKAEAAHKKARDTAQKLADDFKAFDLEERLQEAAQEAVDKIAQNQQGLKNFPSAEDQQKAIDEMIKRLGGVEQKANQIQQDSEKVRKIGEVLQMAANYKKLLNAQKSIVGRLEEVYKELAQGNTGITSRLEGLAKVQEANRKALIELGSELKRRADNLPEEAATMKDDVAEFLSELERLNIPDPMNATSEAALQGKTTDALSNAKLALTLMEQLIRKPNNGF